MCDSFVDQQRQVLTPPVLALYCTLLRIKRSRGPHTRVLCRQMRSVAFFLYR